MRLKSTILPFYLSIFIALAYSVTSEEAVQPEEVAESTIDTEVATPDGAVETSGTNDDTEPLPQDDYFSQRLKNSHECNFEGCPDMSFMAPKPRMKFQTNGCTDPNFNRGDFVDSFLFEKCCIVQDACYMSCGTDRKVCDDQFLTCLKNKCEGLRKDNNFEEENFEVNACQKKANTFKFAQFFQGCEQYLIAQTVGCECMESAEAAHAAVTTYAYEFWDVYGGGLPFPKSIRRKYLDAEPSAEKHGELLSRLYKKFPEAMHRTGKYGYSDTYKPEFF